VKIPLHPTFQTAIDALAASHRQYEFGGSEKDGPDGVEYRISVVGNGWENVIVTGWCPSPRVALAEMEHLLEAAK
jgi:hypothetical protein